MKDTDTSNAAVLESPDVEQAEAQGESQGVDVQAMQEELVGFHKRAKKESDLRNRIRKLDAEHALATAKLDEVKGAIKRIDGQREKVILDLLAVIDGKDQPELPFKDPAEEAQAAASSPAPAPAQEDDAWRAVTLEGLGITGKLAEQLSAADLNTHGDLADFRAKMPFTELEGIGKGKADKIETAMADWWEKNPRPAGPSAAQDDAGQQQGGASPGPRVYTMADLDLTPETLAEVLYPELADQLAKGQIGRAPKWVSIELDADIIGAYLAVPGDDTCDHLMIPVHGLEEEIPTEEGSVYAGREIGTARRATHRLGASAEFLRVKG